MKMIVAGSRHIESYQLVSDAIQQARILWGGNSFDTVICGRARGVDSLGEKWALDNGYKVEYFPAKWRLHGLSAGPIRNREMALAADMALVIIPTYIDSNGSKNMAQQMIKLNKPLLVAEVGPGLQVKYFEHSGDRSKVL